MLRPKLTVAVCIPSMGGWDDHFGMCLVNLFTHILTKPMPQVRQIQIMLINEKASLLTKKRRQLLQRAIERGADYALMIDTDQTFPSDTLYRLLGHFKPVVACNVATKKVPSSPTARAFNPKWAGGDCIFTDPESTGLQEVWRVGCGIMLVDLSVIKTIPQPWFQAIWVEELQDDMGEDWFFCQRLEEHGVKLYIDHDLSWQVGHMGAFEYTHALVGEIVREEDAAIRQMAENGSLMVDKRATL